MPRPYQYDEWQPKQPPNGLAYWVTPLCRLLSRSPTRYPSLCFLEDDAMVLHVAHRIQHAQQLLSRSMDESGWRRGRLAAKAVKIVWQRWQ